MNLSPDIHRSLFTRSAALSALAVLVITTVVILRPFIAAGLFAAVFVLATWPLFTRFRDRLNRNNTAAASLMTLLIILVLVLPFGWLIEALTQHFPTWYSGIRNWLANGMPAPPAWLLKLPLLGTWLDGYWRQLASDPGALRELGQRLIDIARTPLLDAGRLIGGGLVQLLLATLIAFFFYRDGEAIMRALKAGLLKLTGELTEELLHITQSTVRSVVVGLLGTAAAQGAVAALGFAIAGVPGPLLLGGLTALLSILPGGTVVVWLGATGWLLAQEQLGWAIFMTIWGAGLISSIDNVLRPLLISRGSSLNFATVFIGVIGGALAFGFVGIFIGPTVLALALALWNHWAGLTTPSKVVVVKGKSFDPSAR